MNFIHGAEGLIHPETKFVLNFNLLSWFDKKWNSINDRINEFNQKVDNAYYSFVGDMFSQMTSLITTIPTSLLNNEAVYKMQGIFMGYSLLMMIFLSLAEGYKAILGVRYTRLTTMFGRTFVALIGAGLTVPAIVWLVQCSNLAVEMVMAISQYFFDTEPNAEHVIKGFAKDDKVNFVASVLFMVAFFYFIAKAMFKVGIRWFDLLMNTVASPFAWAAYISDGTAGYLTRWFVSTGKIILTNIVYAFYMVVISSLVMTSAPIEGGGSFFARILLIIGALYRLANPPAWLQGIDAHYHSGGRARELVKKVVRSKMPIPKVPKAGA